MDLESCWRVTVMVLQNTLEIIVSKALAQADKDMEMARN
jgi:hypothetical protein